MMRRAFTCILATLVVCACSSDDASAPAATRARKFTTDSLPAGAVVYVRQKQIDPGHLVLELVGRELPDAYGVAWRLRYDPAALRLAQMDVTDVWNANHVHVAREPRGGLLVAAVGAKGKQSGPDAQDTALAEITFDRLSAGTSRVDFIAERSAVVHSDGRHAAAVQWIGGALSAQ